MKITDRELDRMFTPRRLVRAEMPSPAWTGNGTIATPHGALAYWEIGTGPTVLLVHGWEGTHADMDAFVAPLMASGRRVVTFDHTGHGESAGTVATLFDLCDGVRALAQRLGPLDAIVAHSVGCAASGMALEAGIAVGRIALVATPIKYEDFVRGYAEATGTPPETLLAAIAARGIDLARMNFKRIAAEMTIPALLVHSTDDRITSAKNSDDVSAAWPGSRVLRVEGLGHTRLLRDPATVAAIVEFVTVD